MLKRVESPLLPHAKLSQQGSSVRKQPRRGRPMLVLFSSWGVPEGIQGSRPASLSPEQARLAPGPEAPGACVKWCHDPSAWGRHLTWAERCRGPAGHCRACKECSGQNELEPFLANSWLNRNYCLRNVSLHTCAKLEDYNRRHAPVSPEELALPAGMRLLLYGPSFLNEVAEAVVGAHMFAGDVSVTEAHLGDATKATEETTNCVTPERLSRAHSIEEDIQRRQAKFTFSSGAVLVAVSNYGPLQRSSSESQLRDMLAENDFTHAVYMSPHSDAYFNARCLGAETGHDPSTDFEGFLCPSDDGRGPASYLACVHESAQFKTISDYFAERFRFTPEPWRRLTLFMPFVYESPRPRPRPAEEGHRTFYSGDVIATVGSCKSQGSHESVVVCVDEKDHPLGRAHRKHSVCMQGPLLPVAKQLMRQISTTFRNSSWL